MDKHAKCIDFHRFWIRVFKQHSKKHWNQGSAGCAQAVAHTWGLWPPDRPSRPAARRRIVAGLPAQEMLLKWTTMRILDFSNLRRIVNLYWFFFFSMFFLFRMFLFPKLPVWHFWVIFLGQFVASPVAFDATKYHLAWQAVANRQVDQQTWKENHAGANCNLLPAPWRN